MTLRRTTALLALGLTTAVAAVAGPALLAAPAGASSTVEAFPDCPSGFGSGSGDASGRTFLACGSSVRVYAASGALERAMALPFAVSDVAPSPDGSFLYVARGGASPKRLDRQADGSYALSGTWAPANYTLWGTSFVPKGHWIATDGSGNVYLADGAWSGNNTHTVVKYSPSGAVVTRFGEWRNTWDLGAFYWQLNGLTVTADGSKVVTVEGGNDRLQTWTRQADGSYRATSSFGSNAQNHADRQGDTCNRSGWTGEFASAYDAAFDGAGNLYVLNTTCTEVDKFSPTGQFLQAWDLRSASSQLPHGFAVSKGGDVYVGQALRRIRQTVTATPTPTPTPTPTGGDTTAPTITRAPLQTIVGPTTATAVPLRWTWAGQDDVGVTGYEVWVRSADTAFTRVTTSSATATSVALSLAPGTSYQLRVRAVDGAGNLSAWSHSPMTALDALQETSPALTWSAGWGQAYSPELFGEGLKATTTAGASVSTTFTGREIAWIGPRNAGRGQSKVYVDGVLVATVDQYSASSTSQHRQLLWSTTFATSGTHTLKIVAVGTAGRPRVDVDALVVLR